MNYFKNNLRIEKFADCVNTRITLCSYSQTVVIKELADSRITLHQNVTVEYPDFVVLFVNSSYKDTSKRDLQCHNASLRELRNGSRANKPIYKLTKNLFFNLLFFYLTNSTLSIVNEFKH